MQNEITELRNQVRTLKRIVYGFGCLLVAGVVVSATSLQTVPDVIQAKRFEVINKKHVDGDGLEKMPLVIIGQEEHGGYINVRSHYSNMWTVFDGEQRRNRAGIFEVGVGEGDGGYLALCNKHGGDIVRMYESNTDNEDPQKRGGAIALFNTDVPVLSLDTDPNGNGRFLIMNKKFESVVGIGVLPNGEGSIATLDGNGEWKSISKLDTSDVPVAKPDSDFQFRVGFQNTRFNNNYDYALVVDFDKSKVPAGKRVRVSVVDPITRRVWVDQVFKSSQISTPTIDIDSPFPQLREAISEELGISPSPGKPDPMFKGSLVILYRGTSNQNLDAAASLRDLLNKTGAFAEQQYFTGRMVDQIELEWVELEFVD